MYVYVINFGLIIRLVLQLQMNVLGLYIMQCNDCPLKIQNVTCNLSNRDTDKYRSLIIPTPFTPRNLLSCPHSNRDRPHPKLIPQNTNKRGEMRESRQPWP